MIITIFLFLLGFILITKGADIFINNTVEIGKKTNISELILGATIVSFATTLPELTVSMFAASSGHTTMSMGNAVGSIICNSGLILGLVAVISPFKVDKDMFFSKSTLLIISVITLLILGSDEIITKDNALILILILSVYMISNYRSVVGKNTSNQKGSGFDSKAEIIKIAFMFIIGLVMMVVGSKLLINSGVEIANVIGIPQGIVSLTVIALGTSLPELVSSLTAIKKNHHAISVGNILGANILNITSVISFSALVNDIPVLSQNIGVDFPFMIGILLVLIVPTIRKHKLSRFQGILMLGLYLTYLSTLYVMYLA
jgi:cation:H+ antiporter